MSSSSFDPVPSDRLEITKEVGSALTDFDYRVAASLLKLTKALRLPKDTLSYLVDYLSLNQPVIPVSQLIGFTGFNAKANVVVTGETTTSATYTDLATVGPQLSGLANGQYLVLHGSQATTADVNQPAFQSVMVNAAAATDVESCTTNVVPATVSIATGFLATLSNADNNTLLCKYRVQTAPIVAGFKYRWLIALKYQEL